jgi:hypothetical protein
MIEVKSGAIGASHMTFSMNAVYSEPMITKNTVTKEREEIEQEDVYISDWSGAVLGEDHLAEPGHYAHAVHKQHGSDHVAPGQNTKDKQAQAERVQTF